MQILGGRIECFVQSGGSGPNSSVYVDQQTHVWEIGKSGPITSALQPFPAKWSVTGSGAFTFDNGVGTVNRGQWHRIQKRKSTSLQVRLSGNTIIQCGFNPAA
jgi:hypothetical protein